MLAWRHSAHGPVPAVGVASASAARAHKSEPLARYNLFRLIGRGSGLVIEMRTRGLAEAAGPVIELSRTVLTPGSQPQTA
jgi:hypothetical protein